MTDSAPRDRHPDPQGQERALWEAYAAGHRLAAGGGCPDAMDLAVWIQGIDGEADAALAARLADHLPFCPACRAAVGAARVLGDDLTAGAIEPAPLPVVRAALRLGPSPVPAVTASARWWARTTRWGAAVAASIAVAIVGHHAGALASATPAGAAEIDLVHEMSFGVVETDAAAADVLDELLLAAGEEVSS